MRYLHLASFGLTALGLLTIIGAWWLDLGAATLLGGILLTFAGVVKIAVVQLWVRVAGLGTDRHNPIPPL